MHTDSQGLNPLRRSKRLSVEMESAENEGKADKSKVRTRSALQNITNQMRGRMGQGRAGTKGWPSSGASDNEEIASTSQTMVVDAPEAASDNSTEPSPDSTKVPGSLLDMRSPKEHLPGFQRKGSGAEPKQATTSMDESTDDNDEMKTVESREDAFPAPEPLLERALMLVKQPAPKKIGGESFILDAPVVEYLMDIDHTLRDNELKYRPRPDYMTAVQKDINHTMRGILVAWLVEVAEEYNLSSQTLFLTVSYIDRLLSVVSVHRTKLQLIGITSMLIASKYEEIYPPSVDDFVYIADHTYTRDEVLRMETVILNTLKFALTNATAWEFVRRYTKLGDMDVRTVALSHYVAEMFLQEPQHISVIPSQVAAASCWIAHWAAHNSHWRDLKHVSGYTLDTIRPVVKMILAIYIASFSGRASLQAVRTKYTEEKWLRVALIKPPPMDIC